MTFTKKQSAAEIVRAVIEGWHSKAPEPDTRQHIPLNGDAVIRAAGGDPTKTNKEN